MVLFRYMRPREQINHYKQKISDYTSYINILKDKSYNGATINKLLKQRDNAYYKLNQIRQKYWIW